MQTLTDRMGDDMRLRGFAPKTQQAYRGAVVGLARHFARWPDTLDTRTEDELRAFFLALVTTRKVSRSTRIVYRSGIRFLYERTGGGYSPRRSRSPGARRPRSSSCG